MERLRIEGLWRTFGSKVAVRNLSLEVAPQDLVVIIGPNGAGKTTTLQLIAGLLQPTRGAIWIDDLPLAGRAVETGRAIGYVPDEPWLYEELTAREFLYYRLRLYGFPRGVSMARIKAGGERLNLDDVMDDPLDTYSRGMKQKVSFLSAVLHEPRLLLLDEPLHAVDREAASCIKGMLRAFCKNGGSVLWATHRIGCAAELGTRFLRMEKGVVWEMDRDPGKMLHLIEGRVP